MRAAWRDDWDVSAGELERVREIAFSLPGVTERLSHGAPRFFVHDRRPLCYFHDHHNDDRVAVWCPAASGAREELVAADPERFFAPPTSARGTFATWIGLYLDTSGAAGVDWSEVAEILEDAVW